MDIQEITTPKGIKIWLVEDHNLPLITMQFGFKNAGSKQDEKGKEGTAYLVSGMLDEGAGDLNSTSFQEKSEELAMRLSFNAGSDNFTGRFQTLTDNKTESFELLKLALTKPRFDEQALNRVRKQILTGLKMAAKDPNKIASKKWLSQSFAGHQYGRSSKGEINTVEKLIADDLRQMVNKSFARDNLFISVVGDIDAETLKKTVDDVFGALPETSQLQIIKNTEPAKKGDVSVVQMDLPQSVITFGMKGIARHDDDFIPAFILNYILGGGGFSSRLMEEVREKRGLAYSVYSYLNPLDQGPIIMGGVATKNASVKEAIDLISKEFDRLANEGPSEEEFKDAKNYLTGSYALRFDSSPKIASQLLWIQMENLGRDYIKTRNEKIMAVSLDEVKKTAKKWFQAKELYYVVVGKPAKLN